ncbi:MAG TPA: cytochrome c3 family protein [Desulfuromonadales bacterium]|nr:cytochrome c3 family protein [Desulfuromonadales bacterium]
MKMIAVLVLILSASKVSAADDLIFKHGVKFDHKGHQTEKVGNCMACHDENVGKIAGFGKEWAHKRCIICHDLLNEGRNTSCGACHLTMGSLQRE